MREKVGELISNFRRRNIEGIFCANKNQAHNSVLELLPNSASVGFSGSQTLEQLGIIKVLEARGNKVFNQYDTVLSRAESVRMRKLGAQADYYLASANAVSQNGELVFFSAYGHRIAGLAGAQKLIVICGMNKITDNLETAVKRARNYVTPLNCQRLHWDTPCAKEGVCQNDKCFAPEYKRMCCQILIIESEIAFGRMTVILTGEELGF